MGSEVGLVLTHAGSHVALLARWLAAPTVPRVSILPPQWASILPPGASTGNHCSFLAPLWLPGEMRCSRKVAPTEGLQ